MVGDVCAVCKEEVEKLYDGNHEGDHWVTSQEWICETCNRYVDVMPPFWPKPGPSAPTDEEPRNGSPRADGRALSRSSSD